MEIQVVELKGDHLLAMVVVLCISAVVAWLIHNESK